MQRRQNRRHRRSNKNKIIASLSLVLVLIAIGGVLYFTAFANKSNQQANSKASSTQTSQSTSQQPSASSSAPTEESTASNWLTSKADNQLPILMYHYASSKASDRTDSNWLTDTQFEEELQALQAGGYTTLTAAEAERVITTHEKPSNKMVWLTFDDGSVTLYRDIFPLLKKYKMHATAFIITGFVDNGQSGILNWAQIKEMQESGLVDFGSHTVSHLDLGTLNTTNMTYQLQQSQKELNEQLGQKTNIICYPAGGYNQETLTIAKSLGYQFGLLDPGRNGAVAKAAQANDGLLTLPRFRVSSTTTTQALMDMVNPAAQYNASN